MAEPTITYQEGKNGPIVHVTHGNIEVALFRPDEESPHYEIGVSRIVQDGENTRFEEIASTTKDIAPGELSTLAEEYANRLKDGVKPEDLFFDEEFRTKELLEQAAREVGLGDQEYEEDMGGGGRLR